MSPPPQARVAVGSTGKDAEAFTELRITKAKGRPRVVMALRQGGPPHASLPDLRARDRLLVSCELELTADHEVRQSDSVGRPYRFEPNVEVGLLLAKNARTVVPGPRALLLKLDGRTVSHRRHHDVVVFDNIAFDVGRNGLPWSGSAVVLCTITAWHRNARGGEKLIIGQNNPGGATSGDMAGISVTRLRPGRGVVPQPVRVTGERQASIPVIAESPQKRVVYSHPLDDLKTGEQIRVRAEVRTNAQQFGFPVRTTVEVFLAESPDAIDPGNEARRVCPDSPQISRGNGKNTLPEDAAMDSRKVGVLRIVDDARVRLHVNVMVTSGDPLKKATQGNHSLAVLDGGFLSVTRYPAAVAG